MAGPVAKSFAVRLRAYAAAHFAFDEHLELAWPDARAVLQSEYTGGPDGRAYAVTLYGEIVGCADSLSQAQQRLGGALGNVLPLVAVAANAAVDDPLAIGAFGLNLPEPQDFMWYASPQAADWFPPGARRIQPEATLTFLAAVGHHPETDLLFRATESYRRALGNWVPERRLMAGEFLYIAAETLSRCLIETRSQEQGLTPKNLAKSLKAKGPDDLRLRYLRDEIFAGDDAALDAMRAASDGFEHGYMAVHEVLGLTDQVLERTMSSVRRALILAAGVATEIERVLLSDDYAEPRGLVPALHVVTGQLILKDPRSRPRQTSRASSSTTRGPRPKPPRPRKAK